MRALRLRMLRPPTSDSVLPALLVVAGLVAPKQQGPSDPVNSLADPPGLRAVGKGDSADEAGYSSPMGSGGASPAVPIMSAEDVLAVLPPQAAHSVWLAAFVAELKNQWGYPRAL